ncbi:hypothetical protein EXS74_03005 [Candidatus Woesearchaeota archaeon]|nr:hypothetical protein [Candidatus Woesearchaeota archaeon]
MATVLDVGILEYFVPIFVFMFVMIIMWALLEKVQFFPKSPAANLLIAFLLGVLFILIPELTTVISLVTPWFVILIVFLLLLILTFIFMGVDPKFIGSVFGGDKPNLVVVWAIIVLFLGIFGYAFTQVYGEQIHDITAGSSSEEGSDQLVQSVGEILFTPKVMGMFFLLLIAVFVVRFISGPAGPP